MKIRILLVDDHGVVREGLRHFLATQNDLEVSRNAPLELQAAREALQSAESSQAAGRSPAEVEHLAYLARQKARLAQEAAALQMAEKSLEALGTERNNVLLAAQAREAEYLKTEAEKARREAEAQRREAEEAMRLAQLRAEEAELARLEAVASEARTKKLEAEIVEMQATRTARGLVVTLGDALFDSGRAELKADSSSTLPKVAAFLREYPARRVRIEGFTDSVGAEDYNLGLSQQRAEAVGLALQALGVEGHRILARGYGEMYPVAGNDTPAGRQRNRRVEIIISEENAAIPEKLY